MADLERMLGELGEEIDFPGTPLLGQRVSAQIATGRPRTRARRRWRVLAVALAVFLLAVGTAFAVPASREVILGWFGLQGATVEVVESLPEAPAVPETGLLPGPRFSLAEAEERVGFPILFPSLLGEPDEVHVAGAGDRALVELVYEPDDRLGPTSLPGVGLLLTEFRGDVSPEMIGKLAGQGTLIEEVTVNGEPGIWLEGEPHEVFYRDPSGEIVWDSLRLAGNTLLWERGDLLLRLEADVSKREALRIADSVG